MPGSGPYPPFTPLTPDCYRPLTLRSQRPEYTLFFKKMPFFFSRCVRLKSPNARENNAWGFAAPQWLNFPYQLEAGNQPMRYGLPSARKIRAQTHHLNSGHIKNPRQGLINGPFKMADNCIFGNWLNVTLLGRPNSPLPQVRSQRLVYSPVPVGEITLCQRCRSSIMNWVLSKS
jgi:hypothetical protein